MDIYNPNLIEKKWQDFWDKNKTFKTEGDGRADAADAGAYSSGASGWSACDCRLFEQMRHGG